ncbi:hypothetical protein HMPREF0043_01117 [Actinobaculum sp. oral taxon 183 str. F0552]|nr:hypothetical protein HMPREF0043_01117 [Actinobaculum sp. oral taxon 183 str. F0552]
MLEVSRSPLSWGSETLAGPIPRLPDAPIRTPLRLPIPAGRRTPCAGMRRLTAAYPERDRRRQRARRRAGRTGGGKAGTAGERPERDPRVGRAGWGGQQRRRGRSDVPSDRSDRGSVGAGG